MEEEVAMMHRHEAEWPMLTLAAAFGDYACCLTQGGVVKSAHAAFI
jgi:hypothetical protein